MYLLIFLIHLNSYLIYKPLSIPDLILRSMGLDTVWFTVTYKHEQNFTIDGCVATRSASEI